MGYESITNISSEDLNHIIEALDKMMVKTLEKETAHYNRAYMEKLYSNNGRADQIEAIKEMLLEIATVGKNTGICFYILEHQDWFLEDLTYTPKENN